MHEGECGRGHGWWCGWASYCSRERVLRRLELELRTCFSLPLWVQNVHPLLRRREWWGPRNFVVTGATLLLQLGQKKSGMALDFDKGLGEGERVDGRDIGGGNGDVECL